jgi:tryptophan-rich sensory protein
MSNASLKRFSSPRSWLTVAAFVALVVVVGGIIGTQSLPGVWYENLAKPSFNPPNWLFGPVWLTLYVLIGIAGARIFLIDKSSLAMTVWLVQMGLNWAWSPIWFVLHLLWPAFVVIILILASIIAFIVAAWRVDRISAWLFLPYLAWVGFATFLNLAIALLN